MTNLKRAAFFLLALMSAGCSLLPGKRSETAVARAGNDYLYLSDLKGVVPAGTPSADSAQITRNFIDTWVRQQLIIRQAEKNLSDKQMDFSRQLDNYRNSLVVYAYENELVRQKLDTIVTPEEIEAYYDTNRQNFLLKENIVQLQYVKVPVKSANAGMFRKLLRSDVSADKTRLAELCERYAADYFLDDNSWLPFTDLMQHVPVRTYNEEEFLKNHREAEVQDSLYLYLIRFKDFKIKESVSPLDFEKERIRGIILNKRKRDLIDRMHESLYEQALKGNEIELF